MPGPTIAPHGAWKSPITSDLIVSETIGLREPAFDEDGQVCWIEARPQEGGRYALARRGPGGEVEDITPPGYNARTRVHEYGGGSFLVADGGVYFANFGDQRLYHQAGYGQAPRPLTEAGPMRYACLRLDRGRDRLVCVREDHSGPGEAVAALVAIERGEGGGQARVLREGADFYAAPALSPDGQRLAWVEWDHPNMPWDNTRLCVGRLDAAGALVEVEAVATRGEAFQQPRWSPQGELYFISDREGWWSLYRWREGAVEGVLAREAELGRAPWSLGLSTYDFDGDGGAVCGFSEGGAAKLARVMLDDGATTVHETPYSTINGLRARGDAVVFIAGSPRAHDALVRVTLSSGAREVLRRASEVEVDAGVLSEPEAIACPSAGGRTTHAFFYAPRNAAFTAPPGALPPLLVRTHGGPTAAASADLDLQVQYWTSRGFAVVDVNYGGSSGYGRAYRQLLAGQWGVVDVEDCAAVARHLIDEGWVDGARVAITGGSAGGFTTLMALIEQGDVFAAGASHFGVSDLIALAAETHKFESRYLDGLIAPYPERRDVYEARSPITHAGRLRRPVVFFQGDEDRIVPPNQSERMAQAVREAGVAVAYVLFAGEQHGFRRAENIKRALDGELYFYSRFFGFEPADAITPIVIANLPVA